MDQITDSWVFLNTVVSKYVHILHCIYFRDIEDSYELPKRSYLSNLLPRVIC